MFLSSTPLRHTLMSGLCVSALIMGGCSGGDKVPAEEITVDAASLELTKQDETALSRHFAVKPRAGTDVDTLALLSAAGFDDATYGERQVDGSTVVYTDWTAIRDDATMRAARVELIGVNGSDAGTTLDKLLVTDMVVDGYEGEGDDRTKVMDATVGTLVVVKPSPDLFDELSDVLLAQDGGDLEASVEDMSGTEDFQAIQIEDVAANVIGDNGETGILSLKQIVVGNDSDKALMDVVLESLSFDWSGDSGNPLNLKMDGMTVMGLDTKQLDKPGMSGVGPSQSMMSALMTGLSPSAIAPYRQFDLGTVALRSQWVDVDMEGMEADTDVKGDVTTLRSVIAPMTMTFKDLQGTPVAPYMDVLRENGLAELTLKGSSTATYDAKADRISMTDSQMDIDGGLRTNCNYSLMGLNAAAKVIEDSGLTQPTLEFSDSDDSDAQMEKYFADMEAYNAVQTVASEEIKIESLNCDFQDVPGNSLVERGYAVASEVTGKPVAVLKGGAKTLIALSSLTAQSEFQRDLMDTVGSGLIDFIDTPGQTMTITMAPEQPVSITSLTGQGGNEPTIKPLNLKVDVR